MNENPKHKEPFFPLEERRGEMDIESKRKRGRERISDGRLSRKENVVYGDGRWDLDSGITREDHDRAQVSGGGGLLIISRVVFFVGRPKRDPFCLCKFHCEGGCIVWRGVWRPRFG